MKDLIIVGAGGFAREALYIAEEINQVSPKWNILGFIDDNLQALDNVKCNYKIISTIKNFEVKENQVFAMGIANPRVKELLSDLMIKKGANFVSLISTHAIVGPFATIGIGTNITAGSLIGDCANIGNFVNIAGSMIGQDSVIGDYSTTTGYTNIATASIGKRVFVGSHAVVLNHLKVGDDVTIGAGSIVIKNLKPGISVFGNPAKKIEY